MILNNRGKKLNISNLRKLKDEYIVPTREDSLKLVKLFIAIHQKKANILIYLSHAEYDNYVHLKKKSGDRIIDVFAYEDTDCIFNEYGGLRNKLKETRDRKREYLILEIGYKPKTVSKRIKRADAPRKSPNAIPKCHIRVASADEYTHIYSGGWPSSEETLIRDTLNNITDRMVGWECQAVGSELAPGEITSAEQFPKIYTLLDNFKDGVLDIDILKDDISVVLSPENRGLRWFLIKAAIFILNSGKRVVYAINHGDSPAEREVFNAINHIDNYQEISENFTLIQINPNWDPEELAEIDYPNGEYIFITEVTIHPWLEYYGWFDINVAEPLYGYRPTAECVNVIAGVEVPDISDLSTDGTAVWPPDGPYEAYAFAKLADVMSTLKILNPYATYGNIAVCNF